MKKNEKRKFNKDILIIPILLIVSVCCAFYSFYMLNNNTQNTKTLKDISLNSIYCINNNNNCTCELSGIEDDIIDEYKLSDKRIDLFKIIDNYTKYIKVDIDFVEKNNTKTITKFKIYNKNTNELLDVKSEDELRTSLGLHATGRYTEDLILYYQTSPIQDFIEDKQILSIEYVFKNNDNVILNMNLIIKEGVTIKKCNENQKYKVTFDVIKDNNQYKYIISSIEDI